MEKGPARFTRDRAGVSALAGVLAVGIVVIVGGASMAFYFAPAASGPGQTSTTRTVTLTSFQNITNTIDYPVTTTITIATTSPAQTTNTQTTSDQTTSTQTYVTTETTVLTTYVTSTTTTTYSNWSVTNITSTITTTTTLIVLTTSTVP